MFSPTCLVFNERRTFFASRMFSIFSRSRKLSTRMLSKWCVRLRSLREWNKRFWFQKLGTLSLKQTWSIWKFRDNLSCRYLSYRGGATGAKFLPHHQVLLPLQVQLDLLHADSILLLLQVKELRTSNLARKYAPAWPPLSLAANWPSLRASDRPTDPAFRGNGKNLLSNKVGQISGTRNLSNYVLVIYLTIHSSSPTPRIRLSGGTSRDNVPGS